MAEVNSFEDNDDSQSNFRDVSRQNTESLFKNARWEQLLAFLDFVGTEIDRYLNSPPE